MVRTLSDTNHAYSGTKKSSYALSAIMKAYATDKDKYTGSLTENLNKKLKVFYERCDMLGATKGEQARAFSLMLSGPALEYYFNYVNGQIETLHDMVFIRRNAYLQ